MTKVGFMTDEEQEIMDHIHAAMYGIKDLGLNCNENELTHAVHSLQMFVMIRVLNRDNPYWSNWYE